MQLFNTRFFLFQKSLRFSRWCLRLSNRLAPFAAPATSNTTFDQIQDDSTWCCSNSNAKWRRCLLKLSTKQPSRNTFCRHWISRAWYVHAQSCTIFPKQDWSESSVRLSWHVYIFSAMWNQESFDFNNSFKTARNSCCCRVRATETFSCKRLNTCWTFRRTCWPCCVTWTRSWTCGGIGVTSTLSPVLTVWPHPRDVVPSSRLSSLTPTLPSTSSSVFFRPWSLTAQSLMTDFVGFRIYM